MRTIKFRGKSKHDGAWLYGDLIRNEQGVFAVVPPFKVNMYNEMNVYEVDPDTVGQFTGLYDMNGAEIYEGDICKHPQTYYEEKGEIIYQNTEFVFYVPEEDSIYDFSFPDIVIEIIGNVYDNPELLRKEETK